MNQFKICSIALKACISMTKIKKKYNKKALYSTYIRDKNIKKNI